MSQRGQLPAFSRLTVLGLSLAAGSLALLPSLGCSGSSIVGSAKDPAPSISNFSVTPTVVAAGGNAKVNFTANYSGQGATAIITPGNLSITPAVALSVTQPTATTTYTLTVTDGAGRTTTSTTLVEVLGAQDTTITTTGDTAGKVTKGATNLTATVPAGDSRNKFAWSITNGTITGGQGTRAITYTAGTTVGAQVTLSCTVTNAANLASSGSKTLDIIDVAPAGLAYSSNPATYYANVAITPNAPSSTGGTVVSYAVNPALPTGLSLDTTTGVITGTPTAQTAQATYTITATNSGGAATTGLVITVNPQPAVSFTASPATIAPGGTSILSWTIDSSIASVSITDGTTTYGPFTASGTQNVSPTANKTYTLTATLKGGGTYTAPAVTVSINTTPLAISAFTGPLVKFGETSTLTWTVAGLPLTQTLDGSSIPASARSTDVKPVRRQSFTLAASNSATNTSSTVSVPARGVDLVAGKPGGMGSRDGVGSWASFQTPQSIAADASGNLYVADTFNYMFRKITPTGVVTTIAGSAYTSGSTDATGNPLNATFNNPRGIFPDGKGYIWLCDSGNGKLRVLTPSGDVKTVSGYGGSSTTNSPNQIVIISNDGTTAIGYIADYQIGGIVKVSIDLASMAATPTTISGFTAKGPSGICADANGIVYALDTKVGAVRAIKNDTVYALTGHGITFTAPYGVAALANGTTTQVFVAEPGTSGSDNRIYRFTVDTSGSSPAAVASSGITLAGSATVGAADGAGNVATFAGPQGIVIVGTTAYVTDSMTNAGTITNFMPATAATSNVKNQTIRAISNVKDATTAADVMVSTFVGASRLATRGNVPATGSALAADARFSTPQGLVTAPDGSIFVADAGNNKVRKIAIDGTVTNYPNDAATFTTPIALALDTNGTLYVLEKGTSSCTLQKVSSDGTKAAIAATGLSTSAAGLIVDSTATYLYITDNTKLKQVKIADATVVASTATFSKLVGITQDDAGLIYVVDGSTIKSLATIGAASATTIAGVGTTTSGFLDNATGTAAKFNQPNGITFLKDGSSSYLFVSDFYNSAVRMVSLSGTNAVTTIIGRPNTTATTTANFFGMAQGRLLGNEDAANPEGGMYRPQSIAVTPTGDLVLCTNDTVMQITAPLGK